MNNPYLTEFETICPDWRLNWLDRLPHSLFAYDKRDELVRKYAWAVPSPEAIAAIAALSPIIEIGAGTGYWAKLIQDAGADIVAYDYAPPLGGENAYRHKQQWFDVQSGGTNSVEAHPDRTLFLCWPPYSDPMAEDALAGYEGRTVVYIGEGHGGCNATDAFFDALDADWTCDCTLEIPQWDGIRDYLTIWRRKESA